MRKINLALTLALGLALAAPAWSQPRKSGEGNQGKTLWIAKFSCEPKAAAAVASVQQSDTAALQYSSLFSTVHSFATDSKQPAGSWSLSATETSFSGGSTAKRMMIGLGTGRAHLEMKYELRNPDGEVVWTKKIKSEPSFWSSSGTAGAIQNQNSATSKQAEKLVDVLSKFFGSQN